jgi:alpha-glucosidase
VALMMIVTLRGTPFVFEGCELGLPDAEIPPDRVVDLDGRDPERAPIPWEPPSKAGEGAGFTTGKPWLPLVSDAERLNVATQSDDPQSTLSFARRLLALRRRLLALQDGSQRSLDAAPELFCFVREQEEEETFLVALNFSSSQVPLQLREQLGPRALIEISTDLSRAPGEVDLREVVLGPDEGILFRIV